VGDEDNQPERDDHGARRGLLAAIVPAVVERRELVQPQRFEHLQVRARIVLRLFGRRERVQQLEGERLRAERLPTPITGRRSLYSRINALRSMARR